MYLLIIFNIKLFNKRLISSYVLKMSKILIITLQTIVYLQNNDWYSNICLLVYCSGFHDLHQRAISVNINHGRSSFERKVSLAFPDQSPVEIAEQLTYLDYKNLRRIPVSTPNIFVEFCISVGFVNRRSRYHLGGHSWLNWMKTTHATSFLLFFNSVLLFCIHLFKKMLSLLKLQVSIKPRLPAFIWVLALCLLQKRFLK